MAKTSAKAKYISMYVWIKFTLFLEINMKQIAVFVISANSD